MAKAYSAPAQRILVGALSAAWAGAGAALLVLGSLVASPLVAIMAAAGMVAAAAMLLLPDLALVATSFVIPLERIGRFGDDGSNQSFSLMRVIGLLALASVIIMMLRRRLPPVVDLPTYLYGAFCLLGLASYFYAHDPAATASHAATNLGNFLFLILVINGIRDRRLVQPMMYAWLASTILIGLYQIYDWHYGEVLSDLNFGESAHRFSTTLVTASELGTLGLARRAMGTTSNPAVYGIDLLLTLPFLLYWVRFARSRLLRASWGASTLLVLYNILLTNTRSVALFAAALLLVSVLTGLLQITVARIWAGLAGLPIVLFVTPESVYHRVLDIGAYAPEKATNFGARFDLWNAAIRLGSEHWMTGIGVGNRTEILGYLDTTHADAQWIMAHNEFLQVFVELGIPGVLLFTTFLAVLILYTLRALKAARRAGDRAEAMFLVAALITIVTGIAFAQQVDGFHFPLKGWWLTAGLACVLYRLRVKRNPVWG